MSGISDDSTKDKYLFFYGSLIDVAFSPMSQLWGFAVKYGTHYRYLNEPLYQYPEQALKAAKIHALINSCERSRQLQWLTFYPSDRIIVQSESAIARLGQAADLQATNLLADKQARADFLREIDRNGAALSSAKKMVGLHGHTFYGVLFSKLVEVNGTRILLEDLAVTGD